MDYTPTRKRAVKPELRNALQDEYPHDLQLYRVPPKGQITLSEFQDLALERQKVLQLLEATHLLQHKTLDETKQAFTASLRKEGYHHYARLLNASGCINSAAEPEELAKILEARRRDHISHFVLRLAYSLKDDLQQYMLTHETELFKLRFSSLSKEGATQFLTTCGMRYSAVSQKFKEANRENMYASTAKDVDFDTTEFYELPFDEVVDLISDRRVYVHKGIAYVPQSDLNTVFVTHFRSQLAVELNNARKFVQQNLDDERLQSFLKSLPQCYAGMTKVVWTSDHVPIVKLNDLSKTSYPLCMRTMHEHLMTQHHLKNAGRLQYGLFLKGIGVTMEDAIEFWRKEMSKREDMNEEKFNKLYLYNIKFNYGKLGRRVNYTPLGCNKLITESVGAGDVCGCSYKHMDEDVLTKKLSEYKLPVVDIKEITRLATEGHYVLACTKYFESTHKQLPERMFVHPNHYFAESRKILTKDEETKSDGKVNDENMDVDLITPISPEKSNVAQQPMKARVENTNNLNTSNSITPSRTAEKKPRQLEQRKTDKLDPLNIAAMLNDDSD